MLSGIELSDLQTLVYWGLRQVVKTQFTVNRFKSVLFSLI